MIQWNCSASLEDEELSIVKSCLQRGTWDSDKVKSYEMIQSELGVVGDMLVRGNKLVVPKVLRKRMLTLAHEGHPGETVMKRRLRDRVWWPGMDREVTAHVSACQGCRLVSLPNKPEPMHRRELPVRPWLDVALDFLGPLPSGEYLLVIIDYYSRYKEVEIMKHITAEETIARLRKIFTRLGLPVTITLDNARQFVSASFEDYCKQNGIMLNYSTPYWPQENGLVERQNRSLLKRLQISHSMGRDWKSDLQDYLLMYYTSPHSITGKTPTELCYGRTIRSKIPSLIDFETVPSRAEITDRDKILKERSKESENAKRQAKLSDLEVGDTVLMKNLTPGNKLMPNFNPSECVVVNKEGSRVTVRNKESSKVYQRNAAHLKKVPSCTSVEEEVEDPPSCVDAEQTPTIQSETRNQMSSYNFSRVRRQAKQLSYLKDFVIHEVSSE